LSVLSAFDLASLTFINGEAISPSLSSPVSAPSVSSDPALKSGLEASLMASAAAWSALPLPEAALPEAALLPTTTIVSAIANLLLSSLRRRAALEHTVVAPAAASAAGPPVICTISTQRSAALHWLSPPFSTCPTTHSVTEACSHWAASTDWSAATSSNVAFSTTSSSSGTGLLVTRTRPCNASGTMARRASTAGTPWPISWPPPLSAIRKSERTSNVAVATSSPTQPSAEAHARATLASDSTAGPPATDATNSAWRTASCKLGLLYRRSKATVSASICRVRVKPVPVCAKSQCTTHGA
jgi:hypothetical protein